jgi:hypothetical protein
MTDGQNFGNARAWNHVHDGTRLDVVTKINEPVEEHDDTRDDRPMPGNVFRRAHAGSFSTKLMMSADKPSIRSSSRRQSFAASSIMRIMRGDSTS